MLFYYGNIDDDYYNEVISLYILTLNRAYFKLFFFHLFAISWAAPAAYGGSQARGQIGAVATGLCRATATRDPRRVCNLHQSSWQRWIFNPLRKARCQTRNLMVLSRIR